MTDTRGSMARWNGIIYEFAEGPNHADFRNMHQNKAPCELTLTSRRRGRDGQKDQNFIARHVTLRSEEVVEQPSRNRIHFEGEVIDPLGNFNRAQIWLYDNGTGTILSLTETPFLH